MLHKKVLCKQMWMLFLGENYNKTYYSNRIIILRLKDETKNQMFELHVLEAEQNDT